MSSTKINSIRPSVKTVLILSVIVTFSIGIILYILPSKSIDAKASKLSNEIIKQYATHVCGETDNYTSKIVAVVDEGVYYRAVEITCEDNGMIIERLDRLLDKYSTSL